MTSGDYGWVETSSIGEAGCVTVVPKADRGAVLAAFGADQASGRPADSFESLDSGDGSGAQICVVEVDDAIVVFEDNNFQGLRPEVLGPASKASGAHIASSFFWNVNAVTAFSAARRGTPVFSVELIGAEDDDLEGVPQPLRRHVVAAGQDHMLAAGLDLVRRWTRVDYARAATTAGTVYDAEPPASELPTRTPESSSVHGLKAAPAALAALTPELQRRVAEWAAATAAREGDIAGEPAVARVLDQLGHGTRPDESPAVAALARSTSRLSEQFERLEELSETNEDLPPHPFYELTTDRRLGETRTLSHLERTYLSQRWWALRSLQFVSHVDAYSAAHGCLEAASFAFNSGRTERGWTFTKNESGRFHTGIEENPRHTAFIEAAGILLAHLPERPDRAIEIAAAGLPAPLTADERWAAIRADARAAADGAFAEYQIGRAYEEPAPTVGTGTFLMPTEVVVRESAEVDEATRASLRRLWARSFGDRFDDHDAEHAFGGVHVMAREGRRVVAHASAVPREIRFGDAPWQTVGYVEAVATDPDRQGWGLGRQVMERLQTEVGSRWDVALLSTGRATGFYEALGWEQWLGPSFTQTEEGVVRDDEHGGLMVFTADQQARVDRTTAVTCKDRPGHAW